MTHPDPEHLLQRAVGDDQPQAAAVQLDLERGRSALRRRRLVVGAGSGLLVAATVGGVLLVGSGVLGAGADLDGLDVGGPGGEAQTSAPPDVATTAPTGEPVSGPLPVVAVDDVRKRCDEQILDRGGAGDPERWKLAEWDAGPFLAGQVVTFLDGTSTDGEQVSCQIPGLWKPSTAVDLEDAPPAADDVDQILAECGTIMGVDLSAWTVEAAVRTDDGVRLEAVLLPPDESLLVPCRLVQGADPYAAAPFAATAVLSRPADVRTVPIEQYSAYRTYADYFGASSRDAALEAGCGGASCQAVQVSRSGVLPAGVASMSIMNGGTDVPVPVGAHGIYAYALTWQVDEASPAVTLYDDAGAVLDTFDLVTADGSGSGG